MPTVLEIIQKATAYLQNKGIENPRLNAEYLLASTLNIHRLELYLQFDTPLQEPQLSSMREKTIQRARHTPLQHILGTVNFLGHNFICNPSALIPRPETEQLVELFLQRLPPTAKKIIDVGTGSGIIAISILLAKPDLHVVATDICPLALELAQKNAQLHGVNPHFQQANLIPPGLSFDAIIANLPYIPTSEIQSLQPEVLHEPTIALDGGPDGLSLIRELITLAPASLNPGGLLALETNSAQPEILAPTLSNFRDIQILKDYQGHSRFLFASYG